MTLWHSLWQSNSAEKNSKKVGKKISYFIRWLHDKTDDAW